MIQNPHAEQGTSPPTTNRTLNAALTYASRGRSIFPLVAGSKTPFSKSHECGAPSHQHGFKDATTDPAIITTWWTEHPDANIGLCTGKINDITVLDVDMNLAKGKQGAKTLSALLAEHGDLPITLRQRTWSGGVQYIFAYHPEVPSRARVGGLLDIDARNDGGYVVVPPSTVAEGEQRGTYTWSTDPDTVPLPMPEWLVERIKTAPASMVDRSRHNPIGWADEKVHGVPEGTREGDCIKLLGRYAAMRPPLSKEEVLAFLLSWAEKSLD